MLRISVLPWWLLSAWLVGCSGSSNSPVPVSMPAPVAVADFSLADNGQPALIDVLANDQGGGSALTLVEVSAPASGTARIAGARIEYAPRSGFFGVDRFSYSIRNASGQTASAQVSVSSALTVTLQGSAQLVRPEPMRLRASGGALLIEQLVNDPVQGWTLRLRSETPDHGVLLEAIGSPAEGLQMVQHFVSLLPSVRALRARLGCMDGECLLNTTDEPRLTLGSLPTAEYGLLRELVDGEALIAPQTRDRVLGYVVADTLLHHAALVERGAAGGVRPDQTYLAEDTLALVLSRPELAKVERQLLGPGSGSIANQTLLEEARRRMAMESPWADPPHVARARLERGTLTWLYSAVLDKRFMVVQWRDGRLFSHGDRRGERTGQDAYKPFRRLQVRADAQVEGAVLVLRARELTEPLAVSDSCPGGSCSVFATTRLEIHGVLGSHVFIRHFGPPPEGGAEVLRQDSAATVLEPIPISADRLPGSVYTALFNGAEPNDPHRSFYIAEQVDFSAEGSRFVLSDQRRGPASPRRREGTWRLDEFGTLHLDDPLRALRERVHLVAEGAGRGIALLETEEADGGRRIAAVEWLPLTSSPADIANAPLNCVPQGDGWLPVLRAPALMPPWWSYRIEADGRALRFFGAELPAQPEFTRVLHWRRVGSHLEFVSLEESPIEGMHWWPLASFQGAHVLHVPFTAPQGSPGEPFIAVDQQYGSSLVMRCGST